MQKLLVGDEVACWQVSLWNFLRYNVAGGGDSALYGTESATFYLRNGALNLNIALPLALLAPFVMLARAGRKTGWLCNITKCTTPLLVIAGCFQVSLLLPSPKPFLQNRQKI